MRSQLGSEGLLRDSRQIAIEVPVPEVLGNGRTASRPSAFTSCCDVVLWPPAESPAPEPKAFRSPRPLAILEWKHASSGMSRSGVARLARLRDEDAAWLAAYSAGDPGFVAYAVLTTGAAGDLTIEVRRCAGGEVGPIQQVVDSTRGRTVHPLERSPEPSPTSDHTIDRTARQALQAFCTELAESRARPRIEREMVSRFCFGPLLDQVESGSWLFDPGQIGIEVAVPRIADQMKLSGRSGAKNQVCKDIVIWPRPGMHCWDTSCRPTIRPAVIIEWKHDSDSSALDIPWLQSFSRGAHPFVGYAVRSSLRNGVELNVVRVRRGVAEVPWTVCD